MDEDSAVIALGAMANPIRLRALRALVKAGSSGLTAGNIATAIGASPSGTSFHLAQLSDAGLVQSRRDSRKIIYSVNIETIGGLVRYLVEDCCANDENLRACCGSAC